MPNCGAYIAGMIVIYFFKYGTLKTKNKSSLSFRSHGRREIPARQCHQLAMTSAEYLILYAARKISKAFLSRTAHGSIEWKTPLLNRITFFL